MKKISCVLRNEEKKNNLFPSETRKSGPTFWELASNTTSWLQWNNRIVAYMKFTEQLFHKVIFPAHYRDRKKRLRVCRKIISKFRKQRDEKIDEQVIAVLKV